MPRLNLFLLLFVSPLLESCFKSNSICFNMDTQEIKSCNSKGINQIYIINDSINENYRIEWKDNNNKKAPKALRLIPITKGYHITSGWKNVEINPINFRLKSNTKYLLERTQGDASSYKIEIFTDDRGIISKSSKLIARNNIRLTISLTLFQLPSDSRHNHAMLAVSIPPY